MKIIFKTAPAFLLGLMLLAACNSGSEKGSRELAEEVSESLPAVEPGKETVMLLDLLKEQGDYVNSREFPSLIKASAVKEGMGQGTLLIDLRDASAFASGHIPGSVNVGFNDLYSYFTESIRPFEYERIVLVSDDGQLASYTASLLRLMAYGNVYALRWGLSGWSSEYASTGWLAGTGSAYIDRLETSDNTRPAPSVMPEIASGLSSADEIAASRFRALFNEDPETVTITASEVFANPGDYYIINYDRKDKYEAGHIPGAVRYKPGATLGFVSEMASIPAGKSVVVYCGTGHNSAFVAAYLRLFGYDAKSLKYGNNGFMYDRMVSEKESLSWLPFTIADTEKYELESR